VRQMARRRVQQISARTVLASAVTAVLVIAACTTPEPTANTASRAASAAHPSSITGGGRRMDVRHDPHTVVDQIRALARTRHPDLVARNDSTDVIGFVLDENCNVRRDTAAKMATGPKNGDDVLHAVFPGVTFDSTRRAGITFIYGVKVNGRRTWGPT